MILKPRPVEALTLRLRQFHYWPHVGASALVLAVATLSFGLWWHARVAARAPIESVAVLPFVNTNGSPDVDYLSEGITETLISNLAQVRALRVVPRTLVARYRNQSIDPRQASQDLNVRAVVSGQVTQQGNSLRVRAELVDVAKGARLWGDEIDRPIADLLGLQADLLRIVKDKLRLQPTSEDEQRTVARGTHDPVAYQLYLKGRYELGKRNADGLLKATVYFQQSIAQDPSYALGYTGLARSFEARALSAHLPVEEAYKASIDNARKALALNERLAAAHVSLGASSLLYGWNWAESDAHIRRALELDRNNADIYYADGFFLLRSLGRTNEAVAALERGAALDPLSPAIPTAIGADLIDAQRYDDAVTALKRALALQSDFAPAHENLARAYTLKNMGPLAMEEAYRALELGAHNRSLLAAAHLAAGRRDDAVAELKQLVDLAPRTPRQAFRVAIVCAMLGNPVQAYAWLEQAFREHDPNLVFLNVLPELLNLHGDRRFTDLVRRVGIPDR